MQGIWALCMFQVGLSASPYLLRYLVYSRECQFVSYLEYIIGSKFEQHHSNISQDIQDFVINFCTDTICDINF